MREYSSPLDTEVKLIRENKREREKKRKRMCTGAWHE